MTISATVIRKPRKLRNCDNCGKLLLSEPTLRLYGGVDGPPYWVLYSCIECAKPCAEETTRKAIADYEATQSTLTTAQPVIAADASRR